MNSTLPGVNYFDNFVDFSRNHVGDAFTFAGIAFLVSEILVIPLTILFTLADKNGWWKEYKCVPNKRPPAALEQKAWKSLLIGRHFIKIIQEAIYFYLFFNGRMEWYGIPSWTELVKKMLPVMIITDLWGYWYHRTVHEYPSLYRYLHKQHHEFNVSSVYASFYGGDIEDFMQSFLPTYVLPLVFKFNFYEFLVNRALNELFNLHEHIGYQLPWDPLNWWPFLGAEFHDWHHSHNRGNYSLTYFRIWDDIFGKTNSKYLDWKERKSKGEMVSDVEKVD